MAFKVVYAKKEIADVELKGYVNIGEPDKYDPEKPTYKFSIELTGDRAEKLVSAIDRTYKEQAGAMGAKLSKKMGAYKRQDDGSVLFNFKVREFKEGERPFKLWDMGMKPIVDVPNYTAGTIVNLNFSFYISEYKGTAHISMQPTHIQIKSPKIYEKGGDAPTFGKGEGYEQDEDEAPSFGGGQESNSAADDYDDF